MKISQNWEKLSRSKLDAENAPENAPENTHKTASVQKSKGRLPPSSQPLAAGLLHTV
jgi:hypothetical protein